MNAKVAACSMDENRIKYLLDHFADDSLTDAEREELDGWYEKFDLLEDDLHLTYVKNQEVKLADRMWEKITQQISYKRQLKLPYRWAAAVALLVVSSIVGVFYRGLVFEQIVAVTSRTVEVPEGKMMIVELPDGSKVWVRSGSSLSYNWFFLGDQRDVALDGEAFFDVQKNPDKPFVVHSGAWQTKVLGTSFNVKALPLLNVYEVMVKTGKVQVSDSSGVLASMLPSDRVVRRGNELWMDHTDVAQYLQWREGRLIFNNSSLAEIAWCLQNRFDVNIEVDSSKNLSNYPFSGDFTGLSLSQILKIMQEIYPFEIQELSTDYMVLREANLNQ